MDTIGQFCCICGKEDDLETYRERAVSLMNDQEQKYLELSSISSKDNLASESLPEDIKADLLRLVSSMADSIDEVYVVRKIITADFFASAVIVLLNNELEDEAKSAVIARLFQFLDTQDWEFTLFDSSQVPMNTIKKIPLSLFYDSKDHSLNPWHGKTLKS